MKAPHVTVIIPTYNRAESFVRTLHELMESSAVRPDSVIVVDQSQTPDIRDAIAGQCAKYPNVRYIFIPQPSLTKARNTGIDAATTTDVVIFMDDDVDVRPDTIATIKKLFTASDLAMIAGINEEEKFIRRNSPLGLFFCRSSHKNRFIGHVTGAVYGRFPIRMTQPVETRWAMGFFFAVRMSVIRQSQSRFDENLQSYAYAEDLDFSHRIYLAAKKYGMRCIITPEVVVKHNVSTEYRTPTGKTIYMIIAHRRYLSHKLFGTRASRMACTWADIGDIFSDIMHLRSPLCRLRALIFTHRHKTDIRAGHFHYDEFM